MSEASTRSTLFPAIGLTVLASSVFIVQPVYVGALADHWGLASHELGFLVAGELGAMLAASLVAPLWINRVDLRRAGLFTAASVAVGNLINLGLDSFAPLLICRILIGFFGTGSAYVLGLRVIGASARPERLFSTAIIFQVVYGGLGLALFPIGITRWGVPTMLWVWVLMALALMPMLDKLPRHAPASRRADAKQHHSYSVPGLVLLSALLIWSVGLGAFWAFVERLGRGMNLEPDAIGYGLSVGMLLGVLGSVQAVWMSDRWGTKWQMPTIIVSHLGVFFAMSGNLTATGFLMVMVVFNYTWNLGLPYIQGGVAKNDASGKLVVLIPASQSTGAMIGPAIAGLLISGTDFTRALGFSAVCYLAALPLLLLAYVTETAPLEEKK